MPIELIHIMKTIYCHGKFGILANYFGRQNRATGTLFNRIRRLPGIMVRAGVPDFENTTTSPFNTTINEPLYVINGYPIGLSFNAAEEVVNPFDILKTKKMNGPVAATYGGRESNGVILITTRKQ